MIKVLLVEDNEMNQDMLSRRLKRRGFQVEIAEDGLVAVHLANTFQPDIILMDLSLPVMDGWEATRQIRANRTTDHIPIIALTAHTNTEEYDKAIKAGCNDFDTKPVDFNRLLNKMSGYIGHLMSKIS